MEAHAAHCDRCERLLLAASALDPELESALDRAATAPLGLRERILDRFPEQGVAEADECYALGPQISAFIDSELPADEAREVSEHLLDCQVCAKHRDGLEAQVAVAASLRVEPSPRLAARLARSIESHATQPVESIPWWRRLARRPVWSMAASVVLVLGVFLAGWGMGRVASEPTGSLPQPSPSVADGTQYDAIPLVRQLPEVGLAEVHQTRPAAEARPGTSAGNESSNMVRVVRRPMASPARSVGSTSRSLSDRGRVAPVRALSAAPEGEASPGTGPADANRKGESRDLIGRAWSGLIGEPGATGTEAPAPPGKSTESRDAEALIVEAVTVERRGGPVEGEFIEPSASAMLY
jgi:hypothetical protein